MKKIIVAIVVILLFIPAAACKKAAEKIAEKAIEKAIESESGEKVDIDISGESMTIASKEKGEEINMQFSEGKMTATSGDKSFEYSHGEEIELSKDFPGDIPIYPDANLLSQMKMGPDRQRVIFSCDDTSMEVYEFYLKRMPQKDWEIKAEVKTPPNYMLQTQKKGLTAVINIGGKEEDTSVLSIMTMKEEG